MAEAFACAFRDVRTKRRALRGYPKKEVAAAKYTNSKEAMEGIPKKTPREGVGKRPHAEWDYRSFSVIVAKTDEKAVGAGLEKIISERRLVASYNWDVESWIPTIVVPGAPKIFNPWLGGLLEVRNQVMTIDEESFRIPNAPMEPLFTALRLCQPNFKLSDVDLVADLNCLKKLLRFVWRAAFPGNTSDEDDGLAAQAANVQQKLFAGGNKSCDFRIDCQMIGRTLILMRRENEHRGRAMGYGVAYLDACTKPYDGDRTVNGPHKRVTYVQFGNLRLLLRHKTLAAIYPTTSEGESKQISHYSITAPIGKGGGDNGSSPASMGCSSVRYVRGGYKGDHSNLTQIEFASVSKERKSPLVIDKWLDMLFIGSNHLCYGQHVRGRFEQPTMRSRADALDLSGLPASDGRRILVILEVVLDKIIQFGRRRAGGFQRGKGFSHEAGDGERKQVPATMEPFSFALVTADECRKMALYKIGPNNGKSGRWNQPFETSPACVSQAMMAALLAQEPSA